MTANSYYSQEGHGPYELMDIGTLELEEGGSISNCQLAVATHGTLNAEKDNAILVPTWYSGTSKIIEDVYIGSGRALDPDKYFIVVVNQIGDGFRLRHTILMEHHFPRCVLVMMYVLNTNYYGNIWYNSLALVVGGSMGAQQTYEWAVRYPDMVKRAAPIAGTAKNTEHDFVYTETLIEAIITDPKFNNGNYADSDRSGCRFEKARQVVDGDGLEYGVFSSESSSSSRFRINASVC